MARPRSAIVDPEKIGVYHCISRCVRRESLIATPARRTWIMERLRFLSSHAAIDVLAFAIMTNHIHLLLRIRPDGTDAMSDRDAVRRRIALLPSQRLRRRLGIPSDAEPADAEVDLWLADPAQVARARRDLCSLGFFHRLLKEPCARMWNREDRVSGHFWEGRYQSLPVLDEASLARVASYIELNEVRACAAATLETSLWTSASLQCRRLGDGIARVCREVVDRTASLDSAMEALERIRWEPAFASAASLPPRETREGCVPTRGELLDFPLPLVHYIDAVDRLGRRLHPAKPGGIDPRRPRPIATALLRAEWSITDAGEAPRRMLDQLRAWSRATEPHRRFRTGAFRSLPPMPRPDLSTRVPRGSCYGSASALAAEARRRGTRRVLPARLDGDAWPPG